jgi:hypothetical protein
MFTIVDHDGWGFRISLLVRIEDGSFWVDSDAYPLRNISHVGQEKRKIKKWPAWKLCMLRTLMVLIAGGVLSHYAGVFGNIAEVMLLGGVIWRLVVRLRMPPVYGLIVSTSGIQRDAVWSTAKHEIDNLAREVTRAIGHPDVANYVANLQQVVTNECINMYGSGNIGKATHSGSGNIVAGQR